MIENFLRKSLVMTGGVEIDIVQGERPGQLIRKREITHDLDRPFLAASADVGDFDFHLVLGLRFPKPVRRGKLMRSVVGGKINCGRHEV